MNEDNSPVIRKDVRESEERLSEQMRDIETAILKAMHGYAQSVNPQVQRLTGSDAATQVRLSALESRVLELETRRRNL